MYAGRIRTGDLPKTPRAARPPPAARGPPRLLTGSPRCVRRQVHRAYKHGVRFYNRGIPDGYGWDAFFGLGPTPQLEEASRICRYDTVFVLDPLDTFEDPDDIVWAKEREIRRVHELIVQGYYDAGYEPVFIAPDAATARLDFLCANLRLPKPSREA